MLVYYAYAKVSIISIPLIKSLFYHHIFTAWTIVGVRLEHGPNQESNNTLITVNGIQGDVKALLCSSEIFLEAGSYQMGLKYHQDLVLILNHSILLWEIKLWD